MKIWLGQTMSKKNKSLVGLFLEENSKNKAIKSPSIAKKWLKTYLNCPKLHNCKIYPYLANVFELSKSWFTMVTFKVNFYVQSKYNLVCSGDLDR